MGTHNRNYDGQVENIAKVQRTHVLSIGAVCIFIEKGKATLKGLVQSWGNFEVRTLSGLRSLAVIISSWETKNNFEVFQRSTESKGQRLS